MQLTGTGQAKHRCSVRRVWRDHLIWLAVCLKHILANDQIPQEGKVMLFQNGDGVLLTSTGDVVWQWKEYWRIFSIQLTPSDMGAEVINFGKDLPIIGAEVVKIIKQLWENTTLGGLSWLTCLCIVACKLRAIRFDWQIGASHFSASPGQSIQGRWRN